MRKPWLTITIDRELLEKLDKQRRSEAVSESKDISRSAYVSKLIEKGLNK